MSDDGGLSWGEKKSPADQPADDLFCANDAIGYASFQLPVDLERHPHRRVGPCQGHGRVSFPVHDVNVGASGQEQPVKKEKNMHSLHSHRGEVCSQPLVHSRDTLQVALSGGDVQRRVSVHVHRRQGAAGVQHQLCDVHAAGVRRPMETYIQLLQGASGRV